MGPFGWGLVASLIGKGVGGLFQAGAQRRAQAATIEEARRAERVSFEREDSQLQRMMEDAKKAGIHPVAALGASGSHGQASAVSPSFEASSPIGDAIADGGAMISDMLMQREEIQLQREHLALQREQFELAEAQSRSLIQAIRRGATDRAEPVFPISDARTTGIGPVVNTGPFGISWGTPDNRTPQQVIEDQYGGIVGELYGATRAIEDMFRNLFSADQGFARFNSNQSLNLNYGQPGHEGEPQYYRY